MSYLKSCVTSILLFLILLFFCILGNAFEAHINNKYIFFDTMPFSFINYKICILIFLFIIIIILLCHKKINARLKFISKFCALLLVCIVTIKDYTYYSKDIRLLKQNYFEQIALDKISFLMDSEKNFTVYIGRNDCEFCQEVLPIICKYACYGKQKIYYYSTSADREYNSTYLNHILNQLNVDTVPVVLYINNGIVTRSLLYEDILQNYNIY